MRWQRKVFIQIKGREATVIIEADKVQESGEIGRSGYKLEVTSNGQPVGKFDGAEVVGWWVGDIPR